MMLTEDWEKDIFGGDDQLDQLKQELEEEHADVHLDRDDGAAEADHTGHYVEEPPVEYIGTMGAWIRGDVVTILNQ